MFDGSEERGSNCRISRTLMYIFLSLKKKKKKILSIFSLNQAPIVYKHVRSPTYYPLDSTTISPWVLLFKIPLFFELV